MEFRAINDTEYFPPTVQNGCLNGYTSEPTFNKTPVHLMTVSDGGLELSGVFLGWGDIESISISGNVMTIHNKKYASDFKFVMTGMQYVDPESGDVMITYRGYAIAYTLMNRITFELQRIEREMDVF